MVKVNQSTYFAQRQMINEAFLLIGGNVGATTLYLRQALYLLEEKAGTVLAASPLYSTAAWGNTKQNDFLNQAIHLQTTLSPASLLNTILQIEQMLGRERHALWAPRTIDIDILLYGKRNIQTKALQVPHPRLQERLFALKPLADIGADFTHPVFRCSIADLLEKCTDQLSVEIYSDTN
ncbi:MAG: 2-amino-4-hydroxy-6-hydroxymethyldihydropteridine diphosphokinase [Bacteroidota bacterium]